MAKGCVASMACGSALTELVRGKTRGRSAQADAEKSWCRLWADCRRHRRMRAIWRWMRWRRCWGSWRYEFVQRDLIFVGVSRGAIPPLAHILGRADGGAPNVGAMARFSRRARRSRLGCSGRPWPASQGRGCIRCAALCVETSRALLVTGAARNASMRFAIHEQRMAVLAVVFGSDGPVFAARACVEGRGAEVRVTGRKGGQSTGVIMAA